MKFTAKFTDGRNEDFAILSEELEREFYTLYGGEQKKNAVSNSLSDITDVILLYDGNNPFACAGFKKYNGNTAELKRVYVNKEYRGNGYSTYIIKQLLDRAKEKGYKSMILETGKKQPAAISLYKKLGFQIMENYGRYVGDDNSICMNIHL